MKFKERTFKEKWIIYCSVFKR